MQAVGIVLVSALLGGVSSSSLFQSSYSLKDPNHFGDVPYVQSDESGASLRWTYGTIGFFFSPESKVIDGRLVFALRATSSSGALAGKPGRRAIERKPELEALKTKGAYWREPNGREVKLEVRAE